MSKGWTVNCGELFELVEQKAPIKESCLTKSELRFEAEKKLSGINGSRLNECLEQLQGEGKVKQDVKCVQMCDCYYDPPTPFDWRPVVLFFGVVGLGWFIWQVSKRYSRKLNSGAEHIQCSYVVRGTLAK